MRSMPACRSARVHAAAIRNTSRILPRRRSRAAARQRLEDVPPLVHLPALDQSAAAEVIAHRPGERLRSRRAGALSANSSSRGQSLVQLGSKIPSAAQQQDSPREFPLQFRRDDWSGRQDLNLRPPGPERAPAESHGVSSAGTAAQPPENTGKPEPGSSDGVAENGYVETPFGAPVVRELPADPGPHERLMTVREVASRLGVCTALVYKLCQRNELRPLRIGGALRFHRDAVESFLASRG